MKLHPPSVLISTLLFYKEDVSESFLTKTLRQLDEVSAGHPARIRFVVALNYENPQFAARIRTLVTEIIRSPRLDCTCVENHYNHGFGRGHNEIFAAFPSDIFIALNNDLFIHDNQWLSRVMESFENPATAIAGAQESASYLNEAGYGIPVGSSGRAIDFVEGSLLAIRSSLVQQLGLFAADLDFFYFEDSDLCLRYRAAGYAMTPLNLPHEHLRYSSTSLVPKPVVEGVLNWNQPRFFSRWKKYVETGRFTRRILVSVGNVDERVVLASLPALLALAEQHPRAELRVTVPATRWSELLRHPRLSVQSDECPAAGFEQAYDLAALPGEQALAMGPAIAAYLGVSFQPNLAQEFLRGLMKSTDSTDAYAVIDRNCFRQGFEGVDPAAEVLSAMSEVLSQRGLKSITVGDDVPATKALAAVAGCSVVVGGDGPLLQLAQLLGKRSFTIFGATLPTRTIYRWSTSGFFLQPELDCLGCHERWNARQSNYCLRRDEACMRLAAGTAMARELADFLDGQPSNFARALEVEQRLQMNAVERKVRCTKP